MSSQTVTGKTAAELHSMRLDHEHPYLDFEEWYCLAKIARQPDSYDGPQRYCSQHTQKNCRCRYHGGTNDGTPENLDKLANMKHGMYATDEHLRETMDEKEEELYDWVLSWPDAYDINLENDPSAAHDFQTLATEIVREARGKDFILREGEIREKGVYLPDGTMVETEELPNGLSEQMASQVRLIQKIKTSLGITQKEQAKRDDNDMQNDVMETMASAMSSLVEQDDDDQDGGGYDPEKF
jgi:hypothetical protein